MNNISASVINRSAIGSYVYGVNGLINLRAFTAQVLTIYDMRLSRSTENQAPQKMIRFDELRKIAQELKKPE